MQIIVSYQPFEYKRRAKTKYNKNILLRKDREKVNRDLTVFIQAPRFPTTAINCAAPTRATAIRSFFCLSFNKLQVKGMNDRMIIN